MSLVHESSPLCAVEQLELFHTHPTCTQVLQTVAVPHYNITSLDSSTNTLEFLIQGSGDQYVDLARTKLYLQFRITTGAKGEKLKDTEKKVAPLTNFIGSAFQQCDIFLNDKLVTGSNNMYAHRAYLEQLLNYSPSTTMNQLSSNLFYPDQAGKFDSNDNHGFGHRRSYIEKGVTCEVMGPLFTDINNQRAYMLNNVDIRIRLIRSQTAFCLMAFDAKAKAQVKAADGSEISAAQTAKDYNIVIEKAVLWVQKVTLNPSNQLAIETMLRKQNAVYNMQRTELKSFTIGAGSLSFSREHINLGLSPKYALIGLVSTAAMQGDYEHNPFNFQHFYLKHISLNVDGEQVPRNGIDCNYAEDTYLEAYESLVDVVGKWKTDCPLQITRKDFAKGYALYGFQIAPDLVDGAFNLVRNSNIRLDVTFDRALEENVTVLVWFAYDGVLEVDRNREVFYDFSA